MTPASPLTDAEVSRVHALAKSDALKKFLRGSPLRAEDARDFWTLGAEHPKGDPAKARAETAALLTRAFESFTDAGPTTPTLPPLSTCFGLLNLHRLMAGKFAGGDAP